MAYTATSYRPSASAPGDGSRTVTITNDPTQEEDDGIALNPDGSPVVGALRLRGAPRTRRIQRVVWSEDVVDNEGCGKKSSKICCIYHKPKRFDESSDEDSSDSDSDSDSSCGHEGHRHGHSHHGNRPDGDDGAAQARPAPGPAPIHQLEDDKPNAYEAAPGSKKKGKRKAGTT